MFKTAILLWWMTCLCVRGSLHLEKVQIKGEESVRKRQGAVKERKSRNSVYYWVSCSGALTRGKGRFSWTVCFVWSVILSVYWALEPIQCTLTTGFGAFYNGEGVSSSSLFWLCSMNICAWSKCLSQWRDNSLILWICWKKKKKILVMEFAFFFVRKCLTQEQF